jgi:amino acid adenylation domain-containing protein
MNRSMFDVIKAGFQSDASNLALPRAAADEPFALTTAQRQVWNAQRISPGSGSLNLAVQLSVRGALNLARFTKALAHLLDQHDALRIGIRNEAGEPIQRAHSGLALPLQHVVSHHDAAATSALVKTTVEAPFNLDHPPLFRALLIEELAMQHRIVFVWHHIIFDGWSFERFMADLDAAYRNLSEATTASTQFLDWLKAGAANQHAGIEARAYWQQKLVNSPMPVALASVQNAAVKYMVTLPFSLNAAPLDAFARSQQVSVSMLLLASLHALFARLGESDDVIVGMASAGRMPGNEKIIGPFSYLLPIRAAQQSSFIQQVQDMSVQLSEAIKHQHGLPEQLPKCSAWLAYQNLARTDWTLADLHVDAQAISTGEHGVDHLITIQRQGKLLAGHWEIANRSEFDASALLKLWLRLFKQLLAAPELAITQHDWGQSEAQTTDATCLRTSLPTNLWQAFEQAVHKAPDSLALAHCGQQISYLKLHALAAAQAKQLAQLGAAPGKLVLICLSNPIARIVALLATVNTGAGYVPLDHFHSQDVLGDDLAKLPICAQLLDDTAGQAAAARSDAQQDVQTQLAAQPLCAYVMFTSGSTGRAKAVAISQAAIVQLALADSPLKVSSGERVLQLAAFGFDGSSFEIWGTLLNGATLLMPEKPAGNLPITASKLAQQIRQLGISTLYLNGSWLQTLVDYDVQAFASVKRLIAGGDVMSAPHVCRLLSALPQLKLINGYGPTENSVFSSCFVLDSQYDSELDGPVPIGTPLPNRPIFVLDKAGHALPNGISGEAGLAGAGLMLGYLNRADIGLCSLPVSTGLIYRSGDRVIRDEANVLHFLGRQDRQVKLRGFRVELDRVEALLLAHAGVQAAMARVEKLAGGESLVAYVVPSGVNCAELRVALCGAAARYEVPDQIIAADRLPHLANGKLDRSGLTAAQKLGAKTGALALADQPAATQTDDYARAIHRIYAELLAPYTLTLDDDFFDCGGNSILALRAAAKIEAALNVEISMQQLYQAGSARALAQCLIQRLDQNSAVQKNAGLLAPLFDGATPIYIIPGGHGSDAELKLYQGALRSLAPQFGLTGIRCGLIAAQSLQQRAAQITELLCAATPEPIVLIGECVGGMLAYEVANQLNEKGKAVNLMLMDTWCPTEAGVAHYRGLVLPRTLRLERARIRAMGRRDLFNVLSKLPYGRPAHYPRWKYLQDCWLTLKRVNGAWRQKISTVGQAKTPEEALGQQYIEQSFVHRPSKSALTLHLLFSDESSRLGAAADWRALAQVRTYCVPGNHHNYLRTHAELCVLEIKRWLACG